MSESSPDEGPGLWRSDGLVVHYLDPTKVSQFNNPVATTRAPEPEVAHAIEVIDVTMKECYLVLVHQVNQSCDEVRRVDALVKFSEQRYAPYRARELWLRTPAYYRREENSGTEPKDPHDASLTMDGEPWARRTLAPTIGRIPVGSLEVTMTFSSLEEPWVYCTSIWPASEAERWELGAEFPRYDAMTVIRDPEAFAFQLGIDFAISVQESVHFELSTITKLARWQNRHWVSFQEGGHPIRKVIRVYHGPVVYEDESGVLESMGDIVNPSMAVRAWFTKQTRFSGEREYRFAVSTQGKPRNDTFRLWISDELRSLTARV